MEIRHLKALSCILKRKLTEVNNMGADDVTPVEISIQGVEKPVSVSLAQIVDAIDNRDSAINILSIGFSNRVVYIDIEKIAMITDYTQVPYDIIKH